MKKAQRSQRKWLKLSLKIDFFGMKNYKKSWVDPPVSHYIYNIFEKEKWNPKPKPTREKMLKYYKSLMILI